ncbi:MAG TPA: serine/threonine-protein kinase [Kofleriaceae bacterium]
MPGTLRAASTAEELLYGEDLGIGARVGHYIIEELRGRGGFATIYRARHQTIGRIAAIKVLHRRLITSTKIVQRFIQEARATNMIAHPNIVDIYELDELPDGRPYLVMEWIEGRDLDQELRARGRLSTNEALALLEDIAAALGAAHAAGIVHRDLKASNVLTIPSGAWFAIKLVDFGIAKLLDGDEGRRSDVSSTDARLGSPTNMAPEQLLSHPVDARTDIYSLGVLAYQLVTGRLPFNASTIVELQEMHLHMQPPRASDIAPVSPAIDAVIQRCMEKAPGARFQSVDELMAALRRAAEEPQARERVVTAVALHVDVAPPEAVEIEWSAFSADCERVLAEVRRLFASAKFTPVVAASSWALGVKAVADEAEAVALTEAAQEFSRRLLSRADPVARVRVAMRRAPVTIRADHVFEGDLLFSHDWAEQHRID